MTSTKKIGNFTFLSLSFLQSSLSFSVDFFNNNGVRQRRQSRSTQQTRRLSWIIYYTATVVKKLDTNSHAVQYKNLVEEEDMSKQLIETVSAEKARPVPPRIKFGSGFSVFDKVDAFDNDGWWIGKVTGRRGPLYFVYLETTGDGIAYHVPRLRIHLEWVNGKLVSSKKMVS